MGEQQCGIIIKSTGSLYKVRMQTGDILDCTLKGRYRKSKIKTTNPVTVGDEVTVQSKTTGEHVISKITERRNYLVRKSSKLSKQYHLVAANVDQIMLVTTIIKPKIVFGFIDRVMVSAEAYGIPVILVVNKFDLLGEKNLPKLAQTVAAYEEIGYSCIVTSTVTGEGIEEVKSALTKKRTVITGQSGVGKSTLINTLQPGLNIKTAEVSASNEKGRHTTTFAEMHALDFGAEIIDTPGVRSFGIADFKPEHLGHYFPEMRKLMNKCKFNNCVHVNEPGCAVKEALEGGEIWSQRYVNYMEMYKNENVEKEYK